MNRLKALGLASLVAPMILSAPQVADAQLFGSSSAPLDIAADHNDFQPNDCVTHYSGSVEVLRENSRLRSDRLNVFSKVKGATHAGDTDVNCGELDRIEAEGDVFYVTPKQVVRGDHAVYSADAKTIVITGQVVVAEGKNVTAGDRLLIHTDTHEATMESDNAGRGQSGRVRAVIYPKSAQGGPDGGLQPPVPPPPRQHGA